MALLKLAALDERDLEIISAHVQDAVMKVGDLVFHPGERRFAVGMNRFVWEKRRRLLSRRHERRRSVLVFDRVLSVSSAGIDRTRADEVLALLAVRFIPGDSPAGEIELIFSGDAAIRLEAECIEARLTDLGPAWDTTARPVHRV